MIFYIKWLCSSYTSCNTFFFWARKTDLLSVIILTAVKRHHDELIIELTYYKL